LRTEGQIIIYNVIFNTDGPQPVTVSYRGENDLPDRYTTVGTFMADINGVFHPPVEINGLKPGKNYFVRVETCGCVFEQLMTPTQRTILEIPDKPGAITGATALCPNTQAIYSIAPVAGATGYTWKVPAGWTIISGQGSSIIRAECGAGPQSGNITVTADGIDGSSPASVFAATVYQAAPVINSIVAAPGFNVCAGAAVTFVAQADRADTYLWTVPNGWTSGPLDTDTLNAVAGAAGDDGVVTLLVTNHCGQDADVREVTVAGAVGTPGPIQGLTTQTPGATTQVYSIAAVPGATAYYWSVPTGWIITSDNGTYITVTVGPTGGNVSVTASNVCGGASANLAVVVNQPPAGFNYTVAYTNNKAIHVQIHYGTGAPSNTLLDADYVPSVPLQGNDAAFPFVNQNVQLNLSAYTAPDTHIVTASLYADGVLQPAPVLGANTAYWTAVSGSELIISFITG